MNKLFFLILLTYSIASPASISCVNIFMFPPKTHLNPEKFKLSSFVYSQNPHVNYKHKIQKHHVHEHFLSLDLKINQFEELLKKGVDKIINEGSISDNHVNMVLSVKKLMLKGYLPNLKHLKYQASRIKVELDINWLSVQKTEYKIMNDLSISEIERSEYNNFQRNMTNFYEIYTSLSDVSPILMLRYIVESISLTKNINGENSKFESLDKYFSQNYNSIEIESVYKLGTFHKEIAISAASFFSLREVEDLSDVDIINSFRDIISSVRNIKNLRINNVINSFNEDSYRVYPYFSTQPTGLKRTSELMSMGFMPIHISPNIVTVHSQEMGSNRNFIHDFFHADRFRKFLETASRGVPKNRISIDLFAKKILKGISKVHSKKIREAFYAIYFMLYHEHNFSFKNKYEGDLVEYFFSGIRNSNIKSYLELLDEHSYVADKIFEARADLKITTEIVDHILGSYINTSGDPYKIFSGLSVQDNMTYSYFLKNVKSDKKYEKNFIYKGALINFSIFLNSLFIEK